MKHDTRDAIESPSGLTHFWRSHLPRRTFCGIAVRPNWRVIGDVDGEWCERCLEKDDVDGFCYYHGNHLPESDLPVVYCECGHLKTEHDGECRHCECKAHKDGPIEPYTGKLIPRIGQE